MTKPRQDGLTLLFLGVATFLLIGTVLESTLSNSMIDFKLLYYSSRCLLHNLNPYNASEVLRLYRAEALHPTTDAVQALVIAHPIYFPSAFSFTILFAMLPWTPAHILWMVLIAGGLILAALAMLKASEASSPTAAGGLLALFLCNCSLLLLLGNAAAIAVSFCIIAGFCFVSRRFERVGILCFAISLMLKPHDSAFAWLYFLLSGGAYRKRALQVLVVVIALSLPTIFWITHIAPAWVHDLRHNLSSESPLAQFDDPSAAALQETNPNMVIDLQSALSVFWSDARIDELVSFSICGAMLLVWVITTMRLRGSMVWFALAAIAPISMLVTYHRPYDATLLMLGVPAFAVLWDAGGLVARASAILNVLGVVLTGTIPLAILQNLANNLHVTTGDLVGEVTLVVLKRPASIILLVLSIFNLWVYVRRAQGRLPLKSDMQVEWHAQSVRT